MSFIQFFGSALQVTPHFHSLVPDGTFVQREGGVHFEPLPPPTQDEVERLLRGVRHRVLRLMEKRGALPAQGPEDALHVPGALPAATAALDGGGRPAPSQQAAAVRIAGGFLPARQHAPACRVDQAEMLRRTFDFDVFACVRCGGRRSVFAYVKGASGVRAILEHLGLPTAGASLAPARGPPQPAWC
nr:transposase [Cystobacter fuscus]